MGSEILLAAVLLIGGAASFWIILHHSAGKISGQYRLLAERFGLELDQPAARMGGFVRPDPSVYGRYRGREISFAALAKGIKDNRQIESVVKVELKDKMLAAELRTTGLLGGLGQGGREGQDPWKSGDEAFDKAVKVRTNQPRTLAEVLTDERRAWLAGTLRHSKATIYIGDGIIAYAKLGLIADEATRRKFEAVAEFLCDLAEAIEK
ncbi:hypothetical protein [Luteolibacter marinus]|uniref:hypothetical protein n=1 Tax=Luteolibacter marinus TaxID=2776705 RepID=UPI00186707B5|nr:hypothetical protein [Luteolibacter marinus]